jgi:hypothetical protein
MTRILKELFEASVALEGNEWNSEVLSAVPACKGVLLFADETFGAIQLLQSANLRRTAQARLIREDTTVPVRKTDLSQCTRHVFHTCCCNDFSTHLELLKITHTLGGNCFEEAVRLPRTSFAAIDLTAPLPYFCVSARPVCGADRKAWGLFASRKAVQEFCLALNGAFRLCRNPSLLQTGNEPSCPYFQMQQCPGPCMGNLSRDLYMQQVAEAICAADGSIDEPVRQLTNAMRQAAAERQFEQAQSLKERIGMLSKLKESACPWTDNLERFCILHADRGPKVQAEGHRRKLQQYIAWKITRNRIGQVGRFTEADCQTWTSSFAQRWQAPAPVEIPLNAQEHFGLLSLLLFRSKPQGVWINASNKLPDAQQTIETIMSHFAQKKEDAES